MTYVVQQWANHTTKLTRHTQDSDALLSLKADVRGAVCMCSDAACATQQDGYILNSASRCETAAVVCNGGAGAQGTAALRRRHWHNEDMFAPACPPRQVAAHGVTWNLAFFRTPGQPYRNHIGAYRAWVSHIGTV